ncbi:PssD/Cps14F family polysaccharide biosynthesis glycosyltransferase [Olivibacter ginsenosidimutans]|uniref:PssD/Cps14F family polysaccharide biosynthesis glycosyltransferase n=1 Tax=Olivibacter ginsenosidimutans TaxID=1176537 RepID=A0ABP9ASE8_9SPHI
MEKKKVLAIASVGGHWIELLRLKPFFDEYNTVYISTKVSCKDMVGESKFYHVTDFNRWNKAKMIGTIFKMVCIFLRERPSIVISTGAAPGLIGLLIGKILFAKTIWIDSIANVEELSLSGKIATKFADKVFVQWPDLTNEKIQYIGNVL